MKPCDLFSIFGLSCLTASFWWWLHCTRAVYVGCRVLVCLLKSNCTLRLGAVNVGEKKLLTLLYRFRFRKLCYVGLSDCMFVKRAL